MDALTLEQLTDDPALFAGAVQTAAGIPFTVGLLERSDEAALGRYFDSLTEAVSGVYGPHPLHSAHAGVMCADIDYTSLLPFLAWTQDEEPAVAAYFLIHVGVRPGDGQRYVDHGEPLVDDQCATLAPCVADRWLEQGLGSAMMPYVIDSLRRLGRTRLVLWGGVRGDNPRAQHFYRKFGFRHVGDFTANNINNLDMVLDL